MMNEIGTDERGKVHHLEEGYVLNERSDSSSM